MRMEVWEKDLDRWLTTPPEPKSHACLICGFDVYTNEELCEDCLEDENKEESKEEMEMSAVELIKSELCSRYGINPEQIEVGVTVWDLESAENVDQIIEDYSIKGKTYDFLKGHNIDKDDENEMQYVRNADHGTYTRNENLLNVRAYTKRGVIKSES